MRVRPREPETVRLRDRSGCPGGTRGHGCKFQGRDVTVWGGLPPAHSPNLGLVSLRSSAPVPSSHPAPSVRQTRQYCVKLTHRIHEKREMPPPGSPITNSARCRFGISHPQSAGVVSGRKSMAWKSWCSCVTQVGNVGNTNRVPSMCKLVMPCCAALITRLCQRL